MTSFGIDIETRSAIDLKKQNQYVYFNDPSTEVLCAAYCADDGPVKIWRPGMRVPDEAFQAFEAGCSVYAHNAIFERQGFKQILTPRHGWPDFALDQWRCTMAMASAAALPASLEDACDVLQLKHRKDVVAGRQMLKYCKPRKARKSEDPNTTYYLDLSAEVMQLICDYCVGDMEAERELFHTIPQLSEAEQWLWELDQSINDRGFYLDVELAQKARKIITDGFYLLNEEVARLTNGQVTTVNQRDRLLKWLSNYRELKTLRKGDVIELLEDATLPDVARRVLELRQMGAQAAIKKVDAFLLRHDADGRVRGSFMYHAAGTGRWSSRGAQVQNLKRLPEKLDIDTALATIGSGDYQVMLKAFPNPLEMIGNCIRTFIRATPGHVLIGCDFSGIEARVTAWLADEQGKLQTFRDYDAGIGPDPYIVTASKIFRKPPEQISKAERQVGKACELAFGFQGGVGAFLRFSPNSGFSDAEIEGFRDAWRAAHPNIAGFWTLINQAVHDAISRYENEDLRIDGWGVGICGRINVHCNAHFLYLTLPTGRTISYPFAKRYRVQEVKKAGKVVKRHVLEDGDIPIAFWRPQTQNGFRDNSSGQWRYTRFYGGLLTENLVQAIARDLLAGAIMRVEGVGFPIIAHVHDEIIIEVPTAEAAYAEKEFESIMRIVPHWADGLPVMAKAWTSDRYIK